MARRCSLTGARPQSEFPPPGFRSTASPSRPEAAASAATPTHGIQTAGKLRTSEKLRNPASRLPADPARPIGSKGRHSTISAPSKLSGNDVVSPPQGLRQVLHDRRKFRIGCLRAPSHHVPDNRIPFLLVQPLARHDLDRMAAAPSGLIHQFAPRSRYGPGERDRRADGRCGERRPDRARRGQHSRDARHRRRSMFPACTLCRAW